MSRGEPGHPPEVELERPQRHWQRRQRDIGYVGWASFLMACAATAVFFAMVDPEVLSGTTTPGWEISRQTGYAIGFFGFWLLTAATSVLVIWLVRTESPAEGEKGLKGRFRGRKDGDGNPRRGQPRNPPGTGSGGNTG
ncbi:MAG: hypothetical protein P8080_00315 [Gammaproteobacteria bacterium]